jgi:hypothetical protein
VFGLLDLFLDSQQLTMALFSVPNERATRWISHAYRSVLFRDGQGVPWKPCPFSFFRASRSISSCMMSRSTSSTPWVWIDLGAQACGSLIDQIDSFIRQVTVDDYSDVKV